MFPFLFLWVHVHLPCAFPCTVSSAIWVCWWCSFLLLSFVYILSCCSVTVILACYHSHCTLSGLSVRWSWWQSSDSFLGHLFLCVHRTHVLGRQFTKVICSCVLLWFFILFSILCVSFLFSCVPVCLFCILLCTVGGVTPLCWWHSFLSLSFVYILSCL